MNTAGQNRVQTLLTEGYDFKLGDYIGKAFDLLHKNLGGFIGFIVLVFIASIAMSYIPGAGSLSTFITTPLTAGMYLVAAKVLNDEYNEFGDFFKGFDFIGPLALMILFSFLLYMAAIIPFAVYLGVSIAPVIGEFGDLSNIDPDDPTLLLEFFAPLLDNLNFGLLFLMLIPLIYLGIAWSWSTFFIIFYKMKAWDALEASRKVITKKFFWFLLFGLVTGLIAAAGIIAIGFGLLYTVPAMMLANFVAFESIVGLPDEDSDREEAIFDHLVE